MLRVDEGHLAALLLGFGQDVQRQRGLTGGFRAVDLDDTAAGTPPMPSARSSAREPVEMASTFMAALSPSA